MIFDSFWTLWFWIAHVIAWSLVSHFTLGVPYDLVQEAYREKDPHGPYAEATEAIILAQIFRFTAVYRRYGVVLVGFSAFLLTMLATLGLLAGSEFALAVLSILGPLTLVYALTVRAAFRMEARALRGAALRHALSVQRRINQAVGVFAVVLTAAAAIWLALLRIQLMGF